jgi:hypothetical protein
VLPVFASFPLSRLKQAGRIFVAGAKNKEMISRPGFEPFDTVEKAIEAAKKIHGSGTRLRYVRYPVTSNRPFI